MRQTAISIARDEAETLAIEALSYLAGEASRLERFLALTGMDPAALRRAAGEPGFHRAILDYLMQDESLLLGFCADHARAPALIQKALMVLGQRPWERDFA